MGDPRAQERVEERVRQAGPAPEEAPGAAPLRADPQQAEPASQGNGREPSFFTSRARVAQTLVAVAALVIGIYFLFPKIVGVQGTLSKLDDARGGWLAVAFGMDVLAYLGFASLFRAVVGRGLNLSLYEAYQITMAGLAAALLFSAGGAGGVVLNYWAVRKAGMEPRRAACRMVAFIVLLYGVYAASVIVVGILLRTHVINGPSPIGLTIVPAGVAALLFLVFLLIALIPGDFERRFASASRESRRGRLAHRLATVPATLAQGTRTALDLARNPSQGGLAVLGAVGYWAANIGILWASFHGYGVNVPLGVVIQGFFLGLAANLVPFAPAGVGAVDAGMIGTFVLFGYPGSDVFAPILTYRLFAFWLPIPPGVLAFFQLRRTVDRWEREGTPATREPVAAAANTS
jgi:uncharacterized protein (TIRG00374 family)